MFLFSLYYGWLVLGMGFGMYGLPPAAGWFLALVRLRWVSPAAVSVPVPDPATLDPRPLGTLIPKPPAYGGSDPGSAGSALARGLVCTAMHELTNPTTA